MTKKKYNSIQNKYCLSLLSLIIFIGCSTSKKEDEIARLQRVRIQKLERRVARQDKIITDLKQSRWIKKPADFSEGQALLPLKKLMTEKRWVEALKKSSELKRRYPNSRLLSRYRVTIFKKMGLKKQAHKEAQSIARKQVKSVKKIKRTR
jgi:hypothetical protein